MKPKNQSITGVVLILAGIAAVVITFVSILNAFDLQTGQSASTLAQSISNAILPACIGVPITLVGLIMVLLGWSRGRKTKQLPL